MADPATLTMGSMALSAIGTGLQAKSALDTGRAQSQMYQYQAGIAEMTKKIALGNRDYAIATGEHEAQRFGVKAAQERGATKAVQGASGLDVGGATQKDVRAGQDTAVAMDLGTIRRNAAKIAYGYSVEAENAGAQSTLYGMASSNALAAGKMNATASLISGASSVSDKWLKASAAGIPGFGSSTGGSGSSNPARLGSLY